MDSDIAIKADHISKTFKLPHEKQSSVKGALINFLKGGKRTYETQQVLKDVSFEIKKGEFFGIVGRNGSGKSTLLKIISGIYSPTEGSVQIDGKLIPFIELGVGFNHELTGRENVYLNGALLGFARSEMDKMYEEIVEFAELERFMDQKLKNYSSGMQVRLAFSIAIRAQSDILVLDEVLAVGDESFQRKCIDVFEKYKAERKTVILVTHDMSNVTRFCNRALLIHDSEVVEIGKPSKIANHYTELNQEATSRQTSLQNAKKNASELRVVMKNEKGQISSRFKTTDKATFEFMWPESMPLQNIGVAIMKESGELMFGVNTMELKKSEFLRANTTSIEIVMDLAPGRYHLMYGAFGKTKFDTIEFVEDGPSFTIETSIKNWEGLVYLPSFWMK